jgi:hypothetical protein
MNILQALMQSPQQIINKAFGNNPMGNNLMNLVNNKDAKGIEQMARNLAKEKGKDPDQLFDQFKKQLGM